MSANIDRNRYRFDAAIVSPWHTQGKPIQEGESVEDIAASIGADVDPQLIDMYVDWIDPAVSWDENATPTPRRMIVPGHRAVIDQYGRIQSVVGSNYKIHTPKRMIAFFVDFFEKAEMRLANIGFLDNGGIMWIQAEVGHDARIKDEIISRFVTGHTSFNGKHATEFRQTDICVVCQNTFMMMMAELAKRGARVKHSTELTDDILKRAKALLGESQTHTNRLEEIGEMLAETPVTRAETMALVTYLADPKWYTKRYEEAAHTPNLEDNQAIVRELLEAANKSDEAVSQILSLAPGINDLSRTSLSILDSVDHGPGSDLEARDGTAWGLFNGVTHFVDHKQGRQRDTALQSAWFGVGNELKNRTLELMQVVSDVKGIGPALEASLNATTVIMPGVPEPEPDLPLDLAAVVTNTEAETGKRRRKAATA